MSDVSSYQKIVENIESLPSFPAIISKLLDVVNSSDTSAYDAAELIEKDPALTSAIIRIANSAFYGIPRSISSVSSAVVILGFNTIRTIAISHSIMKSFPSKNLNNEFDRMRFWQHSIVCAQAAKILAKRLMPSIMLDPESAFCAGILHDIGKLIFDEFENDKFSKTCRYSKINNIQIEEAEKKILGISHSEIGSILADKWALPTDLEYAIIYHHSPQSLEKINEIVTIIHLADQLTHILGVNLWDDQAIGPEWSGARVLLDITDDSFNRCLYELEDCVDNSETFFKMITDE
ncbi:MAG: HDOD domain-containing protein [Chitinispirillia bacterium]|jgi:putative nucleotidyltransferase with HDIG domain